MPRVVTVIVLLAILLLMGAVFFQVMAHFVVPLFLASVLVVVFKPLHVWVFQRVPGYPRVAALATTLLILLAVLLPTVWLGWKAVMECRELYTYLSSNEQAENGGGAAGEGTSPSGVAGGEGAANADGTVADSTTTVAAGAAEADGLAEAAPGLNERVLTNLVAHAPEQLKTIYFKLTGHEFDEDTLRSWLNPARGAIGSIAVSGATILIKTLFGLVIMVLAVYYFLADGPRMLRSMMKLSPLDDVYERELLDKFANISRAVVVASLASAVAQGLLAGVGYYFALDKGAPVFLLTMLTMVLAIVPFAGAAAIWAPTAFWIYFYQPVYEGGKLVIDQETMRAVTGDPFTAICLTIYGVCVVSAIDNVIKPLVLHGQSNLHPLVALISILGGVQTLGPIGILVGPMLVAFIQALMNMINKELLHFGHRDPESKFGTKIPAMPLGSATNLEAEAAALTSGSVVDKLAIAAAHDSPPAPPRTAPPADEQSPGHQSRRGKRRK